MVTRSRSPFSRRKTAGDHREDITEKEKRYLKERSAEMEQSRSRSVMETQRRSRSSVIRSRSRSPFSKRKSADELIRDVKASEQQYVRDQHAMNERSNTLVSMLRGRSRSPFSRRRSAEEHIEDIRVKEQRHVRDLEAENDKKQVNGAGILWDKVRSRPRSPYSHRKSTEEIIAEVEEKERRYRSGIEAKKTRNRQPEPSIEVESVTSEKPPKNAPVKRCTSFDGTFLSRYSPKKDRSQKDTITLMVKDQPKKRTLALSRLKCGKQLDEDEWAFHSQYKIEVDDDDEPLIPPPPPVNRTLMCRTVKADHVYEDLEPRATVMPSAPWRDRAVNPSRTSQGQRTSSLKTADPSYRESSLTKESLYDVHAVLRKMDKQLEDGIKRGKPVSRAAVMDALLSVVDTLEEPMTKERSDVRIRVEDRTTVQPVLSDERSNQFPTGESTEESRVRGDEDSTAEDYTVEDTMGDTLDDTLSDDVDTSFYSEESEDVFKQRDLFSEALDLFGGDVFNSGEAPVSRREKDRQAHSPAKQKGRKSDESPDNSNLFNWNEEDLDAARVALKDMLSFGALGQPRSQSGVTVKENMKKTRKRWEDNSGKSTSTRDQSPKSSPWRFRSKQKPTRTRSSDTPSYKPPRTKVVVEYDDEEYDPYGRKSRSQRTRSDYSKSDVPTLSRMRQREPLPMSKSEVSTKWQKMLF